jgi:hypothetical protein
LIVSAQIVEGAMTVLAGVLVFCFVVDFPDKNNFLTQMETEIILKRVEDDRGDSVPDKQTAKKVLQHLCDWKVWIFGASETLAVTNRASYLTFIGLMFMTQTMVRLENKYLFLSNCSFTKPSYVVA